MTGLNHQFVFVFFFEVGQLANFVVDVDNRYYRCAVLDAIEDLPIGPVGEHLDSFDGSIVFDVEEYHFGQVAVYAIPTIYDRRTETNRESCLTGSTFAYNRNSSWEKSTIQTRKAEDVIVDSASKDIERIVTGEITIRVKRVVIVAFKDIESFIFGIFHEK